MDLDILTYTSLLRDAVCLRHKETPQGVEYLRKCWTLEQTEPDRKQLREQFG